MCYTKIIKKVTYVIGIFILVSGVLQLIFEYVPKEITIKQKNEVGNYGNHTQENYLLFTSGNSIWSIPFICGSKLYLYDIKEDKKYLLWHQKGIFQEFGTEMCFNGENILVFAGRGMGGQPSDAVMIALDGSKKKITIDPTSCIAIKETAIYYIEEIYDEKNGKQFYDVIWEKDIASGVQKKLLQGDEHSFESFKIINGRLFAVDENLGSLVIKNLSTGQVSTHQFSENVYPAYIIPKDEDSIIVIGIGESYQYKIIEYQLEEAKERIIALLNNEKEDASYWLWDNGTYKNGYLYCNDMSDNVVQIDVKTGKTEILITANQLGTERNYCHAEYSQDYIAIEVYHDSMKTLYIFDYGGNLIRKKLLHQ